MKVTHKQLGAGKKQSSKKKLLVKKLEKFIKVQEVVNIIFQREEKYIFKNYLSVLINISKIVNNLLNMLFTFISFN